MKIKILSAALLSLVGCAQSMSGLVDSELYWKDCRPYRFPRDLPVIVPESPNSAVLPKESAPKRASVKRSECSNQGSWQVVDLIPAKEATPAATGAGPIRFDLKDVPPPFLPAR